MNMPINISQIKTMTNLELLDLINEIRKSHGESIIRLNDFNVRIVDELDGENYESFVVLNPNKTTSQGFHLTLEQCTLIGMRESKGVRKSVLHKLKELESAQPKELSRMDLIQLALAAEQENEALKQHVAVLEPKAQVVDVIADTVNTYTIRETAKTIGVQESKLIDLMLQKRWVYRENSHCRRLCAYAHRIDQKVMANKVSKVIVSAEGDKVFTQARVTAFGLTRLTALVAAAGLLKK
ncbi:DNA-binding protein [Acinetobacter sp. ACNIH2]|uniref:phage antirepressor KilAC domain-containing protein n=1 Tax=Acinetobacter sp. ACNIH2 TaxID=1758189 RepID=UPI000CDC2778|nr:phage antirepressor KilAC domain-containing protein [Acinetobacter sp. ACNIH2]AUX84886.1 DNA-binding protein [Acinetobacter sp. ACNIH2]